MQDHISEIKRKLERLRRADRNLELFGASTHRYRLNPRLTEVQLQEFEKKHQVMLPGDYRLYLREIGDGGAGPYYGIFPLEESLVNDDPDFLSRPFPHVGDWNLNWESYEDLSRYEEEYFRDEHIQGALRICHEGCGMYLLLVMTGSERGHIWMDDRASDRGIFSHNPLTGSSQTGYLTWFEAWLDESLGEIQKRNGVWW
jgi:hypothetical protein